MKYGKIQAGHSGCSVCFDVRMDVELTALRNKEITVRELYEKIGSDVTNYKRRSVI